MVREYLTKSLDGHQRDRLRRMIARLVSPIVSRDLPKLARLHGTDKWGSHWYADIYEEHFEQIRTDPLHILEIGIGGYDDPDRGARSLRMWKDYFPRGIVYGLDIYDKTSLEEDRIHIYQGDQTDAEILRRIHRDAGRLDIVIDDGSHRWRDVIVTFETLFPLLSDRGVYVIEDLQTSYWEEYGDGAEGPEGARTSMDYLKTLVDGLNHTEFRCAGYEPSYFDRHVTSVHFYHNIAFIYKGSGSAIP